MTGLLVLALLTCAQAGPSHVERAVGSYEAGRFDEARVHFEAALSDPGIATGPILYDLGNCAYRQGRYAEAVLHYRRALLRMPRDPEITYNLRRTEGHLGISRGDDVSIAGMVVGVADALPPDRLLAVAGVLLATGLLGLVLARRRRGLEVLMAVITLVGALGAARLVHGQWIASPAGVVLGDEITLHEEPHTNTASTLELRAGEVVRIREMSDRWMRVVHPRGGGWTPRAGVGVVD